MTTTTVLRRAFLVVTPLSLAAVLMFHPGGGEQVYEGVRDDVTAWIVVHIVLLVGMPLLAFATYLLLQGVEGRAATVSRLALVPFLVFYTAYEVTVGLGTGLLVDYANGLPAAEQAAVADAIQDSNRNAILADPASFSLILGCLGWIVAMVAAATALRRAGAGWPITVLVGLSALFILHPPPVGPPALVAFAAAALLVEVWRSRRVRAHDVLPPPAAMAPAATAT